jgi:tRNA pseudouridine32 synthase/23S rRNA pseudouridine746 synthase/23S rRNA pseudouridine1911/1915/1917 synthase
MKKINPVPKKYLPKGLTIIYEDLDILVIDKSSGLLSVAAPYDQEETAHQLLTNYIRRGNKKSNKELFVVHRIDRDTSGILLFAKTAQVKKNLQDQWPSIRKQYLAVVHGVLAEKTGTITSFLAEDENYNVYSTTNEREGKIAKTKYKVLKETKYVSLVEIKLLTGRKNQIRVHFKELGHPLVGDTRYGKMDGNKQLTLHAQKITFKHPHSGQIVKFEAPIPAHFMKFFRDPK